MSTPSTDSEGPGEAIPQPYSSSALPRDLVRAIDWLRAHLSEPVRLDTLAQISGVRPRTLESHFRTFIGTTPLGWARQMRLARARQELLRATPQTTVTNIAIAAGFTQLGRFSTLYRKNFGESPSETMRRGRTLASGTSDDDWDEAVRLTMEALPLAFAVAPSQCNRALEALEAPQALAPRYALPKAAAAWCWSQRAAHRFSSTRDDDRRKASRLAKEACELESDDALSLTLGSGAFVLLHQLDEAERWLERALVLDPSLAYAWVRRGWMSAYLGDGDTAIAELRTALQLMPFEPLRHIAFIGMGCAHFASEQYDRAVLWVRSGLEASPGSFWAERVAVAAAALAGARDESRRMGRQLMRKDPDLTIADATQAWPFAPAFKARLGDGLALADLPRG